MKNIKYKNLNYHRAEGTDENKKDDEKDVKYWMAQGLNLFEALAKIINIDNNNNANNNNANNNNANNNNANNNVPPSKSSLSTGAWIGIIVGGLSILGLGGYLIFKK